MHRSTRMQEILLLCKIFFNVATSLFCHPLCGLMDIYISMRSEWAERVGSTPNDSSVGILMSSLWTLSAEL